MKRAMSSKARKRPRPATPSKHPDAINSILLEQNRTLVNDYINHLDRIMTESYLRVARAWFKDFVRRNETPEQRAQYQSLHTDDVEWYDHAFKIHRIGVLATMDVRDSWNHCHDPLEAEIRSIAAIDEKGGKGHAAVIEVVWKGKMANDLLRTMGSGEVAVKASGKEFETHLCCIMRFDERSRIKRIDEYYTRNWDEGTAEEQYRILKVVGSSKQDMVKS